MRGVLLVAARDFVERARRKSFLLANAFIIVAIVAGIGAGAFAQGAAEDEPDAAPTYELTAVEGRALDVAERAQQLTQDDEQLALELVVQPVDDPGAAEEMVASGEVEAALVDPTTLLADGAVPVDIELALATAGLHHAAADLLAQAGVGEVDDEVLAAASLEVEQIETDPGIIRELEPAALFAGLASTLLFALLFIFGQFVAQGIVEEKQSRVAEVVLSSVSARRVLGGKILGLGGLSLAQIGAYVVVALGAAVGFGVVDVLPPGLVAGLIPAIAWFVVGFVLYALLFAMVGSLVPRIEELNTAVLPLYVPLFIGIVAAQAAATAPTSTFVEVAAVIPFTAPVVQPTVLVAGTLGWVPAVIGVLGVLASIALLIPLTTRIYAGGSLAVGSRVSLRTALQRGRRQQA